MSKSMRIEEEKLKRPKRDNDEIKRKEREKTGSMMEATTEKKRRNRHRMVPDGTIPYHTYLQYNAVDLKYWPMRAFPTRITYMPVACI